MSKDLALKSICPHQIVGEWLAIDSNRRTLRPVRYPSSSHIKIVLNGLDIPSEGIHSSVSVLGQAQGSFEIHPYNNQLKISVDSGPVQLIVLPSGNNISSKRIVQFLNDSLSGARASESNGRIKIETISRGSEANLTFQGGSAHSVLGFPASRHYQGSEVIPSWKLVKGDDPYNPYSKYIAFSNPVKGSSEDIFEVSYFTSRQDCRRCSGLGYENDFRHDVYGDPVMVTGVDLLAQEVEKIVFTLKGSNIFYTWYGTSLNDLIGSKIDRTGSLIENMILSSISSTLDKFKNIKMQQAQLQPVRDQEYFLKVKSIRVNQDDFDPTIFRVNIEIQNRAGEVDLISKNLAILNEHGYEYVR